jgi:hypothetical protein
MRSILISREDLEANSDQEETYAEDGEAETAGGHPLRFLSSKFKSQPELYFQEKLFSALFDKLIGKDY